MKFGLIDFRLSPEWENETSSRGAQDKYVARSLSGVDNNTWVFLSSGFFRFRCGGSRKSSHKQMHEFFAGIFRYTLSGVVEFMGKLLKLLAAAYIYILTKVCFIEKCNFLSI